MPGRFQEVGPGWVRDVIASWSADGAASALAPDFAANTALNVFGPLTPGYWLTVEKLRFIVGNANFAGAGGTLSFDLTKNAGGANPIILCTLTITLAAALRGVILEQPVAAALDAAARISPTDTLSLVREAAGTVFTGGQGDWVIIGRQRLQSRAA